MADDSRCCTSFWSSSFWPVGRISGIYARYVLLYPEGMPHWINLPVSVLPLKECSHQETKLLWGSKGNASTSFTSYCSWERICCSLFAKRGKWEWSHSNELGHSLTSLWLTHKSQFKALTNSAGQTVAIGLTALSFSISLGWLVKRHWNLRNTFIFLKGAILHTRVTAHHLLQTDEDRSHTGALLLQVHASFRKASWFSGTPAHPPG